MPSAIVIGKTIQPNGSWVLEGFRFSEWKVEWIVQSFVENSELVCCICWIQSAAREAEQGLAIASASNWLAVFVGKGVLGQALKVWDLMLKVKLCP